MTMNYQQQIEVTLAEIERAKTFVNDNGFDCTTAQFFIVQQYRKALKQHLNNLYDNLPPAAQADVINSPVYNKPLGWVSE